MDQTSTIHTLGFLEPSARPCLVHGWGNHNCYRMESQEGWKGLPAHHARPHSKGSKELDIQGSVVPAATFLRLQTGFGQLEQLQVDFSEMTRKLSHQYQHCSNFSFRPFKSQFSHRNDKLLFRKQKSILEYFQRIDLILVNPRDGRGMS